ncbi:MAG: hypothetical protein PHT13_02890 [Methanosarcina sp.]|nr:hypothetical protein [Methanosarcina sp.]
MKWTAGSQLVIREAELEFLKNIIHVTLEIYKEDLEYWKNYD